MKRLATIACLCLLLTGCGGKTNPPSPQTIKALLQTAATIFEGAMAVTNPQWNQAKLDADINATINAWQVGANWQQNVINLLAPVTVDISDIPNCNTECKNLVAVFAGGIQSVISDLHNQMGTASLLKKPKYRTYDAYVHDWNKVAPEEYQLGN